MSTGFQTNGRDADTGPFGPATAVSDAAPTDTLVASAVGDRCVNCGTTLSSDQRYCVVCGERRGAPRFALPAPGTTTERVTTVSEPSSRPRRPRFGSGATLIAGVGTLLLALLVGFLIGNAASKSNPKTAKASTPSVKIYNEGAGSTGSSAGNSTAGASTAGSSKAATKSSSSSHQAKKPAAKISKKVASSESNAASKVTGGNGAPPATTKVGQKCSGSACDKSGYNKKTHKFDGSFFGQ